MVDATEGFDGGLGAVEPFASIGSLSGSVTVYKSRRSTVVHQAARSPDRSDFFCDAPVTIFDLNRWPQST